MNYITNQHRVTLCVETTPQREEVEAELDMLEEHIYGYTTRTEVVIPDTVTLYVDVYPYDLQWFLQYVQKTPALNRWI